MTITNFQLKPCAQHPCLQDQRGVWLELAKFMSRYLCLSTTTTLCTKIELDTLEENRFVFRPFLPYNALLSLKMPYSPLKCLILL
jgi:hypothetical protein